MLFLGKHVLGRTYIKLLVSLANTSTENCLDSIDYLFRNLKSKNSNVCSNFHSKLNFFSRVNFVHVKSSSIPCGQTIKISSINLFQQIVKGVYSKTLTSKYWVAISLYEHDI